MKAATGAVDSGGAKHGRTGVAVAAFGRDSLAGTRLARVDRRCFVDPPSLRAVHTRRRNVDDVGSRGEPRRNFGIGLPIGGEGDEDVHAAVDTFAHQIARQHRQHIELDPEALQLVAPTGLARGRHHALARGHGASRDFGPRESAPQDQKTGGTREGGRAQDGSPTVRTVDFARFGPTQSDRKPANLEKLAENSRCGEPVG